MLRALTVIQPFATLIANGSKRVENRSWPTAYRGPLAIHAGKAKRYGGEPVADIAADYRLNATALPMGAVVAVCQLVECVQLADHGPFDTTLDTVTEMARRKAARFAKLPERLAWMRDHEHAEGPWCWVLDLLWTLPEPVACNGAQGVWTLDPATEATVRDLWAKSHQRATA